MMLVGRLGLFLAVVIVKYGVFGKETLRLGVLISRGDPGDGRIDYSGHLTTLLYALQTVNDDSSLQYGFTIALNNSKVSYNISVPS